MNPTVYIQKLIDKENLSVEESYNFLTSVMAGEISEIILSSFLTALKMKGETQVELAGFVKAVRNASSKTNVKFPFEFLDTCGTGGDGKNSINISTISALTLASMGIKVAKHGNRSVSSLCGSSDFLDEFGYTYKGDHLEIAKRVESQGFTFLFAPHWHPAMKFAAGVRKELGFRTVFNLLGPLSNPLTPTHQIVGVYSEDLIEKFANVLKLLGCKKAIVCHALDGFDEFSIFQPTRYAYIQDEKIEYLEFSPAILELKNLKSEEVYASTKTESIRLSERVLKGEIITGTYKVALNAGVGLFLMEKTNSIEKGFEEALTQIRKGNVWEYFDKITKQSNQNVYQIKD
jgi:anthranilate phosphoribosyltransferase